MEHKPVLIIDSNYLCFRAMLKLRGLSHDQHPTGVIFGFLRQIQYLAEKFDYPDFFFTWDSIRSYRKMECPSYKKKESKDDPEMANLLSIGKPQFTETRVKVLPKLGFRNIFIQTVIEADDIIAILIKEYWAVLGRIIIVSGDNDLYQLLQPEVEIYNPRLKAIYTERDFIQEKKIEVKDWAWVKAVGGCSSDNIRGPGGVKEISVIKFLKGELTKGKKYDAIINWNPEKNLRLTTLPYPKTSIPILYDEELSINGFEGICLDYGFHSLLNKENFNKWKRILQN